MGWGFQNPKGLVVASVGVWPNSNARCRRLKFTFSVWVRQNRACNIPSCFYVTQGMIGSSPSHLIVFEGASYPYLKLRVKGKVSPKVVVVGKPWERCFW